MKTGTEDKRKQIAAGVLGSIAALLVGYQLFGSFGSGTPTAPPAAPATVTLPAASPGRPGAAASTTAVKVGTTSAQLDPTLHMEPMLVTEALVYSGSGRNIFSGVNEAPVAAIPVPVTSARNTVPLPPPPPPVPCPPNCPPPPPINLKFFGTATQNGTRRAFLLNGDDVFLASAGDVVQRRYRVVSIATTSIVIEDIPNTNKQTLPLVSN